MPEREVEAWAAANDPLTRYAARLVENGWAKAATLKGIDRRVTREIDEATERCLADGALEGEGALRRVRSGGGSPRLWFRGG